MTDIDVFLLIFGIIGTVAFAISGALVAIENKLDVFGVIILGCVTACGGGLLRDTMISKGFAVFTEWWYPLIALGISIIVFLIMYRLRNLAWEDSIIYKTVYMAVDAVGLGTFVVVGAMRCFNYDIRNFLPVVFYSVLTGVGGGMLRDIMVCKIPVIFRKHIYAVAAIVGAILYYTMARLNVYSWISAITTITIVVVIRCLAFKFKWNLPKIPLKNQDNEGTL